MERWDNYFYNVALEVSKNSRCMSRKIGAVLVKDKSIISTGYNGPPRGIPHCNERIICTYPDKYLEDAIFEKSGESNFELQTCPKQMLGFPSGQGLEFCIASHAERNALINAARNGISTLGTELYLTCGVPCKDCLIEIINAGVKEVIITNKRNFYDECSKFLISNSELRIREYRKNDYWR